MGLFNKIKAGLKKTRDSISGSIESMLHGFTKIDEELFEELEELLVMGDVGVHTAGRICEELRARIKKNGITDPQEVMGQIKEIVADMLSGGEELNLSGKPTAILVIGVNGVGKTTTIGKIASRLKSEGNKIVLGAADTFRAAAIDQLEVWAERAGVDIVKRPEGSDPASVVFDTIAKAKSIDADILICDTAGRLHNKKNLMDELSKISRIIDRELPENQKEVLLVLDATTGQNAVNQAREFKNAAGITGIVLTKLDGTAKGGVVLAIREELQLPVKFIGVGEQIDDLQPFNARDFAEALFDTDSRVDEDTLARIEAQNARYDAYGNPIDEDEWDEWDAENKAAQEEERIEAEEVAAELEELVEEVLHVAREEAMKPDEPEEEEIPLQKESRAARKKRQKEEQKAKLKQQQEEAAALAASITADLTAKEEPIAEFEDDSAADFDWKGEFQKIIDAGEEAEDEIEAETPVTEEPVVEQQVTEESVCEAPIVEETVIADVESEESEAEEIEETAPVVEEEVVAEEPVKARRWRDEEPEEEPFEQQDTVEIEEESAPEEEEEEYRGWGWRHRKKKEEKAAVKLQEEEAYEQPVEEYDESAAFQDEAEPAVEEYHKETREERKARKEREKEEKRAAKEARKEERRNRRGW